MAARKQLWHDDETKARIQTSQLINRLQNHALFVDDPEMANYEKVRQQTVMTDSQVRSAFGLLDKTIPNLKAVEHKGAGENGEHVFVIRDMTKSA